MNRNKYGQHEMAFLLENGNYPNQKQSILRGAHRKHMEGEVLKLPALLALNPLRQGCSYSSMAPTVQALKHKLKELM